MFSKAVEILVVEESEASLGLEDCSLAEGSRSYVIPDSEKFFILQ